MEQILDNEIDAMKTGVAKAKVVTAIQGSLAHTSFFAAFLARAFGLAIFVVVAVSMASYAEATVVKQLRDPVFADSSVEDRQTDYQLRRHISQVTTTGRSEENEITHKWRSHRPVSESLFAEENSRCLVPVFSVADYEQCMKGLGYRLAAR